MNCNKTSDEVYLNIHGDVITNASSATGLPTRYTMCRPDKLIFVDEVESNTLTTKDGNVGGEKFLCPVSARPQVRSSPTKESHFTVLGFTLATGTPLMCAIIFAAKALDDRWVLGFDASVPWVGDDDDLAEMLSDLASHFLWVTSTMSAVWRIQHLVVHQKM
jgi:hypothetical protein